MGGGVFFFGVLLLRCSMDVHDPNNDVSPTSEAIKLQKKKGCQSSGTVRKSRGGRPTVSKATLGKLLRDGVERIWAFPNAQIPS